jgi:hypothetical protein
MYAKQLIKSVAVVLLCGLALEAAHADTRADVRAEEGAAAAAETKVQLRETAPAASAEKSDDAAVPRDVDTRPSTADVPAAEPTLIERAVSGVSGLIDRAKAFFMRSDK